jgi:hypothetical protein
MAVGCLPLLVSPTISNLEVTKMLVDGGAGMNLISPDVIKRLQIPDEDLKPTGTFQGVNPGRSQPKGKITLPVTFGGELNYQTEKVVFDVAKIPLPYNGILGRPALAKFMAASHYAYNMLKVPGPMGIITIPSEKKDMVICVERMFKEAAAADADKATALTKERKLKKGKNAGKASRKHSSPGDCAPVDDVPESSCAQNKKIRTAAPADPPQRSSQ